MPDLTVGGGVAAVERDIALVRRPLAAGEVAGIADVAPVAAAVPRVGVGERAQPAAGLADAPVEPQKHEVLARQGRVDGVVGDVSDSRTSVAWGNRVSLTGNTWWTGILKKQKEK